MRILWHSNAAWTQSGYGVQTGLFTSLLAERGHDVHVSAYYGLRGATTKINGVTVYPGGMDAWGNDILPMHYEHLKPDAAVALMDIWVIQPEVLRKVPLAFWAPVDHDPIPPAVEERLHMVPFQWAMSRFAEREMVRVGLKPLYVPHGVDTQTYRPIDRSEARRKLGLKDGQFFAVSVMANKGYPSRKSVDRLLKAWALFVQEHADAVLWLHCNPVDPSGIDLFEMAHFYGLQDANLRFPDVYRMLIGAHDADDMNTLYNAADIMVLPSAGGGFEIPLIEAQAAGCPVITTGVTAMSELVGSGIKLPVDSVDGLSYTGQGSEQANVRPSDILWALGEAFHITTHRPGCRDEARAFAEQYDARKVLDEYMLPALETQASAQVTRRQKPKAGYFLPVAQSGQDVLELGCGVRPLPGATVRLDRIKHAAHVDVAHNLDVFPWPFEDAAFDQVWAFDVLEHLKADVQVWLDECWRILRPDGHLVMRLPAWDNVNSWRDPTHRRVFEEETFDYWDPSKPLHQDYGHFYFAESGRWWHIEQVARTNADPRYGVGDLQYVLRKLPPALVTEKAAD